MLVGQQILQIALDVILQEKNYASELQNYKEQLGRADKVLVTRWTKVLKEFAIRPKLEVQQTLERLAKIDQNLSDVLKTSILPAIFFDRKLNNYCFIKFHTDPQNSFPKKDEIIETKFKGPVNISSYESDFQKLEWKLEITLSTIKMKKALSQLFNHYQVVRPLVLLIFHTKGGIKKTMYMDVSHFQDFRKNVALILKQCHLIETIPT